MLLDKCCVVFGSADEHRLVSTPPGLRGERPQRGRWRSAQRPAAGLAPHVQPRGAVLQPGEEGAQRPPDHRERRRANGSSIQRIRILSFCSVSRLAEGKRGSAPAPGPSRGVASGARITRRAGEPPKCTPSCAWILARPAARWKRAPWCRARSVCPSPDREPHARKPPEGQVRENVCMQDLSRFHVWKRCGAAKGVERQQHFHAESRRGPTFPLPPDSSGLVTAGGERSSAGRIQPPKAGRIGPVAGYRNSGRPGLQRWR
jgi:hypothetical protein